MFNLKSVFFLVLAIGTGALRQITLFPDKPGADFVKDVILMILFFAFLYLAFRTKKNPSV